VRGDRLPLGVRDVEATIMAAVPGLAPPSDISAQFRPTRPHEGSHGEEDCTAC
jgi:hypothetical protein